MRRSRTWVGTDAKVVRHVHVCGDGHLAAATRIELQRLGVHRETDYLLQSLRPALVIACADSEADQSFNDVAQQAVEEGSPLLLCCLVGRVVRLGPLIDPSRCFGAKELSQLPPDSSYRLPREREPRGTAEADPPLNLYARLGALLISAQALNFLLGARNQCVLDRVVELNPWSMESKGYRVFPN
ncbi:MAG TPA: hypothetical protein VNO35_19355 [Steroidobacteraceae bacterium]|jgi:hypothetical protein|nr:hypothetical protein [Steroidobacteraceae bacterium]